MSQVDATQHTVSSQNENLTIPNEHNQAQAAKDATLALQKSLDTVPNSAVQAVLNGTTSDTTASHAASKSELREQGHLTVTSAFVTPEQADNRKAAPVSESLDHKAEEFFKNQEGVWNRVFDGTSDTHDKIAAAEDVAAVVGLGSLAVAGGAEIAAVGGVGAAVAGATAAVESAVSTVGTTLASISTEGLTMGAIGGNALSMGAPMTMAPLPMSWL